MRRWTNAFTCTAATLTATATPAAYGVFTLDRLVGSRSLVTVLIIVLQVSTTNLATTLIVTTATVLYHNLRLRDEASDLERLVRVWRATHESAQPGL